MLLPPLHLGSSAVLVWMKHGQKGTAMLFPARPSASAAVVSGGTAAPVAVDFAPAGFARRARHRIHGVPLGSGSPSYRSQGQIWTFAKARSYTKLADFFLLRNRAQSMHGFPTGSSRFASTERLIPQLSLLAHVRRHTSQWTGKLAQAAHGAWLLCPMLRRA